MKGLLRAARLFVGFFLLLTTIYWLWWQITDRKNFRAVYERYRKRSSPNCRRINAGRKTDREDSKVDGAIETRREHC